MSESDIPIDDFAGGTPPSPPPPAPAGQAKFASLLGGAKGNVAKHNLAPAVVAGVDAGMKPGEIAQTLGVTTQEVNSIAKPLAAMNPADQKAVVAEVLAPSAETANLPAAGIVPFAINLDAAVITKLQEMAQAQGDSVQGLLTRLANGEVKAPKKKRRISVFDVDERLEELYEELMDHSTVTKDNAQLHGSTLAEWRQIIALAAKLKKEERELAEIQQGEEMKAVIEEVGKADPATANKILQRLFVMREARGMLKG